MKYCARCKLRLPESETKCSKCGAALRSFGAPVSQSVGNVHEPTGGSAATATNPLSSPPNVVTPASAPSITTPPPAVTASTAAPPDPAVTLPGEEHLQLELAGLQASVEQGRRWVSVLVLVAAILCVLLVGSLLELRRRAVLEFATVTDIDVRPVAGDPNGAEIVYRPTSRGKIEFSRITPQGSETLVEHFDQGTHFVEPRKFLWSGSHRDYKLRIRMRSGWSITQREFDPPQRRLTSGELL